MLPAVPNSESAEQVAEDRLAQPQEMVGGRCRWGRTRWFDLRVKLQIYARFGVQYYWIMDADAATVQPYVLTPQGYATQVLLHADDMLSCPLFPDITIRVRDLFK